MKRQAAYLSILKDFFRCGIAGWCLEILFTSVEAWMRGDVKIMGTTSVIMFPIYAAGAILPDIVKWCDRWLSGLPGIIPSGRIRSTESFVLHLSPSGLGPACFLSHSVPIDDLYLGGSFYIIVTV